MERVEFEEGPVREPRDLVLELEGFGGPIDLLLALARRQKVDLARISILELVDQYLAFIAAQRKLRLEIAADYLVMAAWLAYLKSRLLLPEPEDEREDAAPELAAALSYRLRRLDAMRTAGGNLLAMPRLGRDVFARGLPEDMETVRVPVYEATLFDLLKAYGDNRRRATAASELTIKASGLHSLGDAMERLARVVGEVTNWTTLSSFLPEGLTDGLVLRSAVASTFAASLEFARTGAIRMRQSRPFGPIMIRNGEPENA